MVALGRLSTMYALKLISAQISKHMQTLPCWQEQRTSLEAKLSKPGSWSLQACRSIINSVGLREEVMDEMIPWGPFQIYFV